MRRFVVPMMGLIGGYVMVAWALAQSGLSTPTVRLDRPAYFTAADGTAIEIQAGAYQLEPAGESRLRFSPEDGGPVQIVQAMNTTHGEHVDAPIAVTAMVDEDTIHVLLLMPDTAALDAQGVFTGIRSRGGDFSRPLTALQLTQAAENRLLVPGAGAPPSPVSIYPAPGAVISGPAVRFQWQLSSTVVPNTRYEICVSELNQPCSSSNAAIYKMSGVPLPDPLLPQKNPSGIRPPPGSQDFERESGTTGTPLYSHNTMLPFQFQGKRLQWSIVACAPPNTRQSAFTGQMPEWCAASLPRPVTWVLPAPGLSAPVDGASLPTVNEPYGYQLPKLTDPSFTWTYGNQQGVEYFLVCLYKPGTMCPVQPGVQANAVVARVQSIVTATLPQNLSTFMGHTLHWTVAACNVAVGCVYQQQYRRLHIPIIDGSFDSIYEVTQNAKCTNCHEMHRENAIYSRHIQLGRFTRDEVPPGEIGYSLNSSNGFRIQDKCRSCHSSANGFTDHWRAPDSQRSLERPLSNAFCAHLKFEPGLSAGGVRHLRNDHIILWAADRIPGLGRARWQQKVDAWVHKGTPCPSDGNLGKFIP